MNITVIGAAAGSPGAASGSAARRAGNRVRATGGRGAGPVPGRAGGADLFAVFIWCAETDWIIGDDR
jgi:hypothetical protein